MTLKFNRVLEFVEVHVHAKFHQAISAEVHELSCSHLFALSRNGEESENPALRTSPCD